jgi:DNA-binding transcriptional regulator YiaG
MYVFGKRYPNIVKVNEFSRYYKVTCETKGEPGRYYTVEIASWEDGIDKEVNDALKILKWIEAGNEFPT